MTQPLTSVRPSLEREALSILDLLIAGMSYMAPGFSLFFTTAAIAANVGSQIPIAYILAGAGVLATGATLAEFSRLAPSAGSLQTFLRRGFGARPSFAGGLLLMTGYLFLQASVAVLFGGWSRDLLRDVGISIPWQILSVLGVLLVSYLMIRGVHISIRATWSLFLIEFVIMLAIGIAVIVSGGAHGLSAKPFDPSGLQLKGLALAMVFATFSFVGFEGSVSYAEETPHPRRALPIAVIGGIAVISLLYVLVGYASAIGFSSIGNLANDSAPIATLAKLYAGPLSPILKIAILTSLTANLMAAGNANARILFNLGRERAIPATLARIHPSYKTPYVAVSVFMVATIIPGLIASSSWSYLVAFNNLSSFGALLALLIYMCACISLIVYVRRARIVTRAWRHLVIPAAGAAIWLIPLWGTIKPGQSYPVNTFPWITLGLIVLFSVYAIQRGRHGVAPDASVPAAVPHPDPTPVGQEAAVIPVNTQVAADPISPISR